MWRKATAVILIVAAVALAAWDVLTYFEGGVDSTVSRTLMRVGGEYSILPLSMGVLAGHFWWPWRVDLKRFTIPVLAVIGVAVLGYDLFNPGWTNVFMGAPIGVFLIGLPLGRYLWPQPGHARLDT